MDLLFFLFALLVLGLTPFSLQICLNSSRHRFNQDPEALIRDFGTYCHDSITQMAQI